MNCYKKRCRYCAGLSKNGGTFTCNELQKEIYKVQTCPIGIELEGKLEIAPKSRYMFNAYTSEGLMQFTIKATSLEGAKQKSFTKLRRQGKTIIRWDIERR